VPKLLFDTDLRGAIDDFCALARVLNWRKPNCSPAPRSPEPRFYNRACP
jgi:hypothetical protein